MTAAVAPGFVLKGRHVLAGVVLFFLIIIGFDAWFTVLAYRSFPGQSAQSPYEAGLAYQQTLDERARQAALGWRVQVVGRPDGTVELHATDRAGAALGGLTVKGVMMRPATERGRVDLVFTEVGPGVYRAASARRSGAWDLELTLTGSESALFIAERRLQWP